jgi:hypothetical protein
MPGRVVPFALVVLVVLVFHVPRSGHCLLAQVIRTR